MDAMSSLGAPEIAGALADLGFVTCTAHEVALLRIASGAGPMAITDEVLARAPRSSIAAVDLERGDRVSRLTVRFACETVWEFQVPTAFAKGAERLAATLTS
jgi:hypothetical protein